jgi:hypothetical protein
LRWSNVAADMKSFWRKAPARPSWRLARSSRAVVSPTWALAEASAISNGRGSMTNRRSPFATICPSLKLTESR